jgi:RNA polymerase sigma-70 factor, ECF subfamily
VGPTHRISYCQRRTSAFSDKAGLIATNLERVAVNHLRLVPRPAPQIASDDACLGAFQQELNYVHRSFRRLGAMSFEVEDLTQDLFLAFRRSWSEYDPNRPLRPYLFGFAFRIAAAHKRKRRREVAYGIVKVDDPGPGPEDALQSKQARALLLDALDQIPLPRRAVLVMHELDDIPVAEIASVLSIPLFTAYSRLRKARRELEAAIRRLRKKANGG